MLLACLRKTSVCISGLPRAVEPLTPVNSIEGILYFHDVLIKLASSRL